MLTWLSASSRSALIAASSDIRQVLSPTLWSRNSSGKMGPMTEPGPKEVRAEKATLPVVRGLQAGSRPEEVAFGFVVIGARLGARAGRLAFKPLRVAGRFAGGRRVQGVTGVVGAEGRAAAARGREGVEAVVGRTLAGPLPEEMAQVLVDQRVIERVVVEVLPQLSLDQALEKALEDPRTQA